MAQRDKVRVYQLARDLKMETTDLLALCAQAGFDVKNQLSNLDHDQQMKLEEMAKKGTKGPAAPAAPVKPVTKVVAPEERAVPNLGRAVKPREPERVVQPAEPEPAPVPEPIVETPAPTVAEVEPAAPVPPPKPAAPAIPVIRDDRVRVLGGAKPAPTTKAPTPAPAPGPVAPTAPAAPPPAVTPVTKVESKPVQPAAPVRPTVTPVAPPRPLPTTPRAPQELGRTAAKDTGPRTGGPPGRRMDQSRRPGGTMQHLKPIAPPSLKPSPGPKPPVETGPKVFKPIIQLTPEQVAESKSKQLKAEDLLRPQQAQPAVETEEDDDKKGGEKKRAIPGREARQKQRNARAEQRKTVKADQVKIVDGKVDIDEIEKHHKNRHRHQKLKPTRIIKGKVSELTLEAPITIRTFSEQIGMRAVEVIFKMKGLGVQDNLSINSVMDNDTAELIAAENGCKLTVIAQQSTDEKLLAGYETPDNPEDLVLRAPIVTVMGHVDHGKTSLLDKIRRSNVVATEAGGITQVIRAWRVEHGGKPVTFLDTPGHEAFTQMRARGAQVTDVAVIVVAADDGVMPQTEEAINHAKAAGVSLVIAINKIDMPSANINKTRQQLYSLGVLPDNMGGDTPFVETSAATGKGIDELLDQLAVVAELKELKANPKKPARGTCLEAMLTEGEGVLATLLVRDGTLRRGDIVICGAAHGRVRQMYNDLGKPISEAGPSVPVRITGLDIVPNASDTFQVLDDLNLAATIAESRQEKLRETTVTKRAPLTLERLTETKIEELKVILKADFRGSIEAIRKELDKLVHAEVRVRVLEAGIGAITENDVWLALASPEDTMIVGFNAVPDDNALRLAEERGIKIREYNIIYNLTNDIRAALEGKLKPREEVIHLGRAIVRETFKISRTGTIGGCYVTQGSIKRSAKVRVIRDGVVIYPPADRSASLESLKRFKEDVGEVREGFECGMKVAGYDDIKVGDVIEAYRVEQVQRTLD
ncbi:MAG TPA: translation initiation factor IF-2 [Gemmataceae bacterium]|nr:translation initiation factor IF-2 [Gemmataceae bacterium]